MSELDNFISFDAPYKVRQAEQEKRWKEEEQAIEQEAWLFNYRREGLGMELANHCGTSFGTAYEGMRHLELHLGVDMCQGGAFKDLIMYFMCFPNNKPTVAAAVAAVVSAKMKERNNYIFASIKRALDDYTDAQDCLWMSVFLLIDYQFKAHFTNDPQYEEDAIARYIFNQEQGVYLLDHTYKSSAIELPARLQPDCEAYHTHR
jgi:hypothetical protein